MEGDLAFFEVVVSALAATEKKHTLHDYPQDGHYLNPKWHGAEEQKFEADWFVGPTEDDSRNNMEEEDMEDEEAMEDDQSNGSTEYQTDRDEDEDCAGM